MSSARQALTIVGKFVGNYLAGPVGAFFGASIGGELGAASLPRDLPAHQGIAEAEDPRDDDQANPS